ncbi:hypothetical protein BGP80_16690 [Pseudomonas putida]|uniref:Uncharacterized protein n=1 Tax=Pseudomonas putida TaxID=303 RepID=A0A2S3WEZ3_PSEPU|nr:hypothetical protein BGP80_16690 [Pseudomonas putida]
MRRIKRSDGCLRVIWPISHRTISTTPNHKGSKPRLTTMGTIRGAVVISIASVSMNASQGEQVEHHAGFEAKAGIDDL